MTNIKLSKASSLKPSSFDANIARLTLGQTNLLNFLIQSIKKNAIIKKSDISLLYCASLSKDGQTIPVKYFASTKKGIEIYKYKTLPFVEAIQTSYIKNNSIQWFKNNLGTCIIKGKILAIPVIEV